MSESTEEAASAAADAHWAALRERALKETGHWERWKDVPPPEERDLRVSAYLNEVEGR